MTPAKTHDLLRLQPRASLILDVPAPEWVVACLAETPWVIVRRGEIRNGIIPIRVRGAAREQRFDASILLSAVAYRSRPEDLAGRRCEPWRAAQVPALAALSRVDAVLGHRGSAWGPIGSIAFELATHLPVSTPRLRPRPGAEARRASQPRRSQRPPAGARPGGGAGPHRRRD